jgi:hypothetical protein
MRWFVTPAYYDKLEQSETILDDTPPRTTNSTDKARRVRFLLLSTLTSLSILLNVLLLGFVWLWTDTCNVHTGGHRNDSMNANFKAVSAYCRINP